MAQKVHDHFAKQYLAYILDDKGKFASELTRLLSTTDRGSDRIGV